MNLAYLSAGVLALVGAAIHGALGEALVVRRLRPEGLPTTRFGGGQATLRLIRAGWHMLTLTFAVFGATLATCSARENSIHCDAAGTLMAGTLAGFAVIAIAGPLLAGNARALVRHPAPLLITTTSLLAWLGSHG